MQERADKVVSANDWRRRSGATSVRSSAAEQAPSSRIITVSEDEVVRDIYAEISTRENEIQGLRDEIALLRQRRHLVGHARQAWDQTFLEGDTHTHLRVGRAERAHNGSMDADTESESARRGDADEDGDGDDPWEFCAGKTAQDEIEELRQAVEALKERDRERQIEVEQRIGELQREAAEGVRVAEEMRSLVVQRERQVWELNPKP